jgi:dynein heavy chain
LAKSLNEEHEEASNVATEVRKIIEEFREHLPLIKCITLPALQDEDWRLIKEVANNDSMEREQITVDKFASYDLQTYIVQIEDIAASAQKKFQLSQKLKQMKEEMKDFPLFLKPYPSNNPTTNVLGMYDEMQTKLEDQIVNTQGILAQIGSKAQRSLLYRDSKSWEKRLKDLFDLIEEVQKCQRIWMYLEPIFASDDIGKTLPEELAMFKVVDTLWRTTMEYCVENPLLNDLVDRENIAAHFIDANKNLADIQRHLNDYLDSKCQSFPRFYFLADDDLLKILAQTKDPTLVQPHMSKCFEGIKKVVFEGNGIVTGMVSAEGEVVTFTKPIDVNEGEKAGNVELWMLEIEEMMKSTLRDMVKAAMADYEVTPREEWLSKWAGQVVLACDQI